MLSRALGMREMPAAGQRQSSIDLVKTAAIFGVLTIHASSSGFWSPLASSDWIWTLFWSSVTRASVPLFLMCSGALFLAPDRTLPVSKLYRKYILRICAAMVFWAIFYKGIALLRAGVLSWESMKAGALALLRTEDEFHLYYLRIILLFYACLPVTRLVSCHASKRELEYLLLVWLFLGIFLPTVEKNWPTAPIRFSPQWALNNTYSAIGYGFLGYYLHTYRPLGKRAGTLMAAAGFGFVFGMTLWASVRQGKLYGGFLEGMSIGTCFLAVGSFSAAEELQLGSQCRSVCRRVSQASFCVYLVHVAFLYLFQDLGVTVHLLPCAVSIPMMVLALFLCSYFVYWVLRLIPYVRRLV